ncbi:putative ribonuclease H-like domain-containing protein [Tanacetum coccineum]
MEHYLSHTNYPIWEVIQKGNGHVSVSTDTNGVIKVLPPKTAEEILARERERKARTTLLMALPEDHLVKFHKITDAKDTWDAIKSRFGGNDESKKMQKYILKQLFEGFSVSNSEGLHKGYDRSLPSSWSQVSLVIRTKPGVDNLSIDDLYNNVRVFKSDIKGFTGSSSSAQNVAFVSSESTNSTNNVSTSYGISTSSGYNSQRENSSSYTDELMYSFFANQSSGLHLDHEDLEQLDEFDLEEMDLKWQVAMISMRLKKFYKKSERKLHFDAKEPVGFDKTKVECYNCHKKGHFARECRSKGNTGYKSKDNGRRPGKQEEPKALVTLDGEGVDWTDHAEDEQENFALMAYSNSGSDTEVTSCSKECVESYAKLKKLYDEQREQLGDASIEIQAYTQALKKVEAQLVTHQKNQLWYEEKIRFMKIDLDDKTDVLTYHKKLLAEAVKEKEELKTKLENFQSSSKGLSKLLNSQMSKRDKSGLGYGDQVHDGVLSYENEVFQSVFDSRSSDVEDSPVHDRFANVEGMHAVPPLMTGNYMPSGPDREVDDSMFTYGLKQSKTSESDTQTSNNLSIDDLYNNLRVFESDIKGSTGSSSSAQNVAFVSSESTSSTNDVSTAYGVSTSSGYNSQRENSSSYTDELMYSFFANQSSGPHLDHEDLEQLDEFDLEEMDLKWQVAMISMRLKKFYKKTGRKLHFDAKEPVGFDKTKVECYNCVDWTDHAEDEQENFALMAYNNSGSDTEVTSCSKECVESYAKLKKLYDEQREQLGDASIEIQAYTQALKKVEAQLVPHQKNQLCISKLLNGQMSKRDKFGVGYGDQVHDGVLSYENEVFQSVFDSRSSDVEDSHVHDRFANVEGMHAVPPPMTGNYMPSGPDREVDDSMFTYGSKQSKTSEYDTQTINFDSCESNSSVETLESMPEPVVVEPKVVSQPKVWSDAPIIEEYESDSDDEYVIQPSKEQEKPSSAFVKHVKTPRETVKEQNTYSPSPKADKRDWNGLMSKRLGLGYGFTKKACFVCGSFSHLIRDCDFHEKRLAKQVELNKKKGKGTSQGENRPVWNNVQRLNHQNQFVPTAVLTRTGRIPVNTASHNFNSQAVSTSAARKVNAVRPIVNENRPRNNFHKSHSPIRRPFNRTTTPRTNFSNQKVNTAEVKAVSAVRGKRETAVKPSAGCNWRPKRHYWNKFSKYNGGSNSRKCVNSEDPLGRPKPKMAWVPKRN